MEEPTRKRSSPEVTSGFEEVRELLSFYNYQCLGPPIPGETGLLTAMSILLDKTVGQVLDDASLLKGFPMEKETNLDFNEQVILEWLNLFEASYGIVIHLATKQYDDMLVIEPFGSGPKAENVPTSKKVTIFLWRDEETELHFMPIAELLGNKKEKSLPSHSDPFSSSVSSSSQGKGKEKEVDLDNEVGKSVGSEEEPGGDLLTKLAILSQHIPNFCPSFNQYHQCILSVGEQNARIQKDLLEVVKLCWYSLCCFEENVEDVF